ncbi:helix-turn-helix transcriptional regulator [Actinopolymorpha pittospori]
MSGGELGPFLRARRAMLQPEDVGMPSSGVRRVRGLRREEVALLAGVSVDYYTRLEQGRERHPSPQVLDALARTFRLDGDVRGHLYRLAEILPRAATTSAQGNATRTISPDLARLLDSWPVTPAYVVNRTLDILARNRLASALYAGFAHADNLARMTFLDPAGRDFYLDWQRAAARCVARLRLAAGYDPRDPRLLDLVAELTRCCDTFEELWVRQDVRERSGEPRDFQHPKAGRLTLVHQAFDVHGSPGPQLVVYQAEPGSASAEALALLQSGADVLPG